MKVRDVTHLLLLAAIWGVSFLLIRIAAPVLGPLVLVTARMLIAGAVLLGLATLTRSPRPALRASWRSYLLLGALNSALPLSLESFAVIHLNASLAAILATLTPLFTVILAAVWLRERLSTARLLGVLLGVMGVAVLVGWNGVALTPWTVAGLGAMLLASLFSSLAGIFARTAFQQTPALALAIGQELAAAVLMLPLALAAPPATAPTLPVVAALITLALLMTAGGNLIYFSLLERVGPTRTQSVSFLIPVFALLAGHIALGEPITGGMLLGLATIFAGVALVLGLRLRLPIPQAGELPAGWASAAGTVGDRHSRRRKRSSVQTALCPCP